MPGRTTRPMRGWPLCLILWSGVAWTAAAQEAASPHPVPDDRAPAASSESAPTDTLSAEQDQVAARYRRLEDLIFKMADYEAASNPRRAALLKQAYKQSKDRLTQSQLEAIVAFLAQKQYKRALDGQETARKDLQELLQLLMSEDRSDRLKTESQRLKDHIKELQRLQRLQRGVIGQTEGEADPRELADKQSRVADRTGELARQLEQEEDRPPPGETPESRPSGEQPAPDTPGQPAPDTPGQPAPGSPPPDDAQAPSSSPPQVGPDEPSPARQRVREAEQKMREAQRQLEEAQRSESLENQREALQKLQEAVAQLEEVLRQLREEEMQRVLALLEGRFRQMLEAEIKIQEATARLDQTPEDQRGRDMDIKAGKLAFDQRKVAGQADRCLTLLREEGSSVAFPEVVEQIRDDMETVSDRLAESKVGTITQELEQEIISSLEEMIAAFQKAQQELDESRPPQPGPPGELGQQPLVDMLAELKMIRSLQLRVNLRTQRYSRLLDDADDPVGQAVHDDLRQALGELGQRQARIHQITRDIVLGKNR